MTAAAMVKSLGPAAWYRYGMGITVTGAGVSQWDDQSGNARHLTQGTDANRPAKNADGSILFDGVDNYLLTGAFALNQPHTRYLLMKQVTWTSADEWFDGLVNNTGTLLQRTASPRISTYAGAFGPETTDLAVNTYGVLTAVFNGASSVLQVNNGTEATGNVGAANMSGLVLGSNGALNLFGHLEVKEVIVYPVAHDAATRSKINGYLARVGGLV